MNHPNRLINWLDMAELDRADIAPEGWQRLLRNRPRGVGAPVPGKGSWLVLRASKLLVSLVDFDIDADFVDHIILDECVMFQFALDGSMSLDVPNGGSVRHDGFRCTMLTFHEGKLVRRLSGQSERIRYVGVIAPIPVLIEDYGLDPDTLSDDFRRFLLPGARKVRMIDYPLHRDQLMAIHAILDCAMDGALRDRFLEAKLSELICLTLAHITAPAMRTSCAEREQLSIEAAAEILSTHPEEKFSLPALSRRVGLNRNKITAGFRDRYGMTPSEFARETRLTHARRLIADTQQSMFEIANITGFTSQSSFSRAYRMRFGLSPREQRRANGRSGDQSSASYSL